MVVVARWVTVDAHAATLVVGAGAVCVAALGVHRNGRSHDARWRLGWSLVVVAAALVGLAAALDTMPPPLAGQASRMLALGAALACVAGLLTLLTHRLSRSRAVDLLAEAVVGGIGAGFLLWALLVGSGLPSPLWVAWSVALLVVDIVGLWLTARLLALSPQHPLAYRYLLAGQLCLVTVHAVAVAAALGSAAMIIPGPTLVLWSLCLVAAAAVHPSLRETFQPVPPKPAGMSATHVGLLLAATLLGPSVIAWRLVTGVGIDLPLALAGTAGFPLVVILHLIRLVQERARGEYRARHDQLTGLPNRVLFHDRLDVALGHARRSGHGLAVMFLDLDRFKTINDSLGHDVGNELLREVAMRITGALRDDDTVARWGGDEFTVLLDEVDGPDDAARVAHKILGVFRDPFDVDGRALHASTSIGVSLYPEDGETADELLKHADTAMYRAKSRRRNTFQLYTREMSARAQLRLAVEDGLRRALARGEIVTHFQPRVDRPTGRIVGSEALARWEHPRIGLVTPSAFIPLAEDSGLITELGEQVLHEATERAARWYREGLLQGPVAVNLSARQFHEADIERLVSEALASSGLPAHRLEIEITESVLLRDRAAVREVLLRLRAQGVRCSIDDFGTGYSGLAYLADMPIDAVKIDRAFVSGIVGGASPIVDAVVALGHSLRLGVIAEGVETREQVAFLDARGCREMQGYLFGRPMSGDAFEQFVRELRPRQERERPERALIELAGLYVPVRDPLVDDVVEVLSAACDDDSTPFDLAAVATILDLLREPAEDRVGPLGGALSLRLAVGGVAGLLPLGAGLATVGALPPPVQTVAADVLEQVGVDAPEGPVAGGAAPSDPDEASTQP